MYRLCYYKHRELLITGYLRVEGGEKFANRLADCLAYQILSGMVFQLYWTNIPFTIINQGEQEAYEMEMDSQKADCVWDDDDKDWEMVKREKERENRELISDEYNDMPSSPTAQSWYWAVGHSY